ncbi:hypothetical protein DFS33DRAFT_1455339 [Desarmillaria ectypa]|nr:hypothetical protein DFS33DRAFT_1455339 [Desarmillaria ectypa]
MPPAFWKEPIAKYMLAMTTIQQEREPPDIGPTIWLCGHLLEPYARLCTRSSAIIQAGRPSQYIFLDSVFRNNHDKNASHHTHIVNFPDFVAQVEAHNPDRLVQEDTSRQQRIKLGTVFPDDRHVIVSSETSTVLQFYRLDYGMEHFSLTLSIPPPSDRFDPEVKLENDTTLSWRIDSIVLKAKYCRLIYRVRRQAHVLAMLGFGKMGKSHSMQGRISCKSAVWKEKKYDNFVVTIAVGGLLSREY